MPKVSVVMSCYNEEKTVAKAIESILAQSFDDFEFIIVDDGSEDQTLDILNSYGKKDHRVKILRNDQNLGLAASLNIGINEAVGQYICRMDADDESLKHRLEIQNDYLDQNPDVDILGTNAFLIHDERVSSESDMLLSHQEIYRNRYKKTMVIHPTVMIRKVCFDNGQYDPNLKWAEDKDLWLRWIDDFTFANIPNPLLKYTIKDRLSLNIFKQNHYVLLKNMRRRGEFFSHFHQFIRSILSHLYKMSFR